MKYLPLILIILFAACKKDTVESTNTEPVINQVIDPLDKPCAARHTYGTNCTKYYGDLLTGVWYEYDSCIIKLDPQGNNDPTIYDTIITFHESTIFDSTLIISKDTVKWFYIRNALNKNKVGSITPSGKDSFEIQLPYIYGVPITDNSIWVAVNKNYQCFKRTATFSASDTAGNNYRVNSDIYVRMVKK